MEKGEKINLTVEKPENHIISARWSDYVIRIISCPKYKNQDVINLLKHLMIIWPWKLSYNVSPYILLFLFYLILVWLLFREDLDRILFTL